MKVKFKKYRPKENCEYSKIHRCFLTDNHDQCTFLRNIFKLIITNSVKQKNSIFLKKKKKVR